MPTFDIAGAIHGVIHDAIQFILDQLRVFFHW